MDLKIKKITDKIEIKDDKDVEAQGCKDDCRAPIVLIPLGCFMPSPIVTSWW